MSHTTDVTLMFRRARLFLEEGRSAATLSELQEVHPEDEREQKELNYLLGWAYVQLRRWDEAARVLSPYSLFNERERTTDSLNTREIQGLCLLRLGEIAIQSAQFEEAGRHLLRALKALHDRRVNLPMTLIRVYYYRAMTYTMRGLYAAAIQDYRQARELCGAQDDLKELAEITNGLAEAYRVSGLLVEAYETARAALKLYRKLDNWRRQCEVLNRLGRIAMKLGDYTAASNHYLEAVTIAGSDPQGGMMVMVNSAAIAELRLEEGQIDEAKRYCAIAEGVSNRLNNKLMRGLTDMTIGKVTAAEARQAEGVEKLRLLQAALTWFEQALEKLKETQGQMHIAEVYGYQAQVLEELGRQQDALLCWREAYNIRSATKEAALEEA